MQSNREDYVAPTVLFASINFVIDCANRNMPQLKFLAFDSIALMQTLILIVARHLTATQSSRDTQITKDPIGFVKKKYTGIVQGVLKLAHCICVYKYDYVAEQKKAMKKMPRVDPKDKSHGKHAKRYNW